MARVYRASTSFAAGSDAAAVEDCVSSACFDWSARPVEAAAIAIATATSAA
jgi:hypothetical protein